MFPSVTPNFNYPTFWGTFDYFQEVKLTAAGAAFYNEKYELNSLTMGMAIGAIKCGPDFVDVFTLKRTPLGKAHNKLEAAEGLLLLYVNQKTARQLTAA